MNNDGCSCNFLFVQLLFTNSNSKPSDSKDSSTFFSILISINIKKFPYQNKTRFLLAIDLF